MPDDIPRGSLGVTASRLPSLPHRYPHRYRVYGLAVETAWELPCPEDAGPAIAEVALYEGSAKVFQPAISLARSRVRPEQWHCVLKTADGSHYVRWRGLFEFLISPDGRRILGRPLENANPESFQTYLLGQVLSFAMLRQGFEPLHATVVVVDGQAVGFLGDSGYGKSSLGAAFLSAGYRLLTDDLLLLSEQNGVLVGHPGPPRIKLYPETARLLFGDRLPGAPMTPESTKRIFPLGPAQVIGSPTPLRALYVLGAPQSRQRSSRILIRRIHPARAFPVLLKNSFNIAVVEPERLERLFFHAQRVASTVPLHAVHAPRKLDLLPELRDAILAHLAR